MIHGGVRCAFRAPSLYQEEEMKDRYKYVRKPVRLIDKLGREEPKVFSSRRQLCEFLGINESALSKRISRGSLDIKRWRIEEIEEEPRIRPHE